MAKAKLTPEILETVAHLSSAEAAKKLGVGKTTVTDSRARYGLRRERPAPEKPHSPRATNAGTSKSSFEQTVNGSLIIEDESPIPRTADTVKERMRARGFDPEQYTIAYRFSEWEAQTKEDGVITMYGARASATERTGKQNLVPDYTYDELAKVITEHPAFNPGGEPFTEGADFKPSGGR